MLFRGELQIDAVNSNFDNCEHTLYFRSVSIQLCIKMLGNFVIRLICVWKIQWLSLVICKSNIFNVKMLHHVRHVMEHAYLLRTRLSSRNHINQRPLQITLASCFVIWRHNWLTNDVFEYHALCKARSIFEAWLECNWHFKDQDITIDVVVYIVQF